MPSLPPSPWVCPRYTRDCFRCEQRREVRDGFRCEPRSRKIVAVFASLLRCCLQPPWEAGSREGRVETRMAWSHDRTAGAGVHRLKAHLLRRNQHQIQSGFPRFPPCASILIKLTFIETNTGYNYDFHHVQASLSS